MTPHYRLLSRLLLAAAALLAFGAGPAAAQGRAARDLPYATSFSINVSSGSGANAYSPDPVPANKRLIIEFVSVSFTVPPGEKPELFLNDSVNGFSRAYWIPLAMVDTANSGMETYRASQLVKLSHDGNGTSGPGAQIHRNVNSWGPMSSHITISGYLIDK